jgi:hypothetical protein
MIENPPDDFLGDVPVDHPGPECVSPLVRGEVHRPSVLVADGAAFQPPVKRQPVSRAADRRSPVDILSRPREQPGRPAGPAFQGTLLLFGDQAVNVLVDGDEGLAFHLVVEVAQIRRCVGVGGEAAGLEPEGVGDPQAAADQDEGD